MDEKTTAQQRLAAAKRLASMRERGLRHLAALARAVRIGLVPFATVGDFAAHVARIAAGYAESQPDDITYRGTLDHLRQHRWDEVSELELNRELMLNLPTRRGFVRTFRRTDHELVLWFTGPTELTGGVSRQVGTLHDERELRAVVTSPPNARMVRDRIDAARPWTSDGGIEMSRSLTEEILVGRGWTRDAATVPCTVDGVPRDDGDCRATVWTHPSETDLKVFMWTVGHAVRIGYWAGPIVDLADLIRIVDREATPS